jgi:hypothetical protein
MMGMLQRNEIDFSIVGNTMIPQRAKENSLFMLLSLNVSVSILSLYFSYSFILIFQYVFNLLYTHTC